MGTDDSDLNGNTASPGKVCLATKALLKGRVRAADTVVSLISGAPSGGKEDVT